MRAAEVVGAKPIQSFLSYNSTTEWRIHHVTMTVCDSCLPALHRAAACARATEVLRSERLQRFVGVSYVKATERLSHYSHCRLSDQYDAVIHMDETHALKPLVKPAPVPPEALRPGTTDYTKWQMLARDLPEEDLSDEEL